MPKPRRQSLSWDNLTEVLTSAKNAHKLGQQQFETPLEVARALMLPLPKYRPVIFDPQCGHGALTAGAANESTDHCLGSDIDPTALALHPGRQPAKGDSLPQRHVIIGDLQKLIPLLEDIQWKADLIVANPPFSLQWQDGDSTLVTWKFIHASLTMNGEGMMLANESTARRLIAPTPEAERIWLWVTLPNFFPGTRDMQVAAIYFARDHTPRPGGFTHLELLSAEPDSIAEGLNQFVRLRKTLINGATVIHPHHASTQSTVTGWRVVQQEWERQRAEAAGQRQGWNIALTEDGRLNCYLTPFQQLSGKVPRELAKELQGLHGKHPAALVVQKSSRMALHRAVTGGIWRVHPSVPAEIERAVQEYHRVRAPFAKLNPVQRLGYLDEEDTIQCIVTVEGFTAGTHYPLRTQTFEGKKLESRPRPYLDDEVVQVTGTELAVLIEDDESRLHSFTQFPPSSDVEEDRPKADFHHTLVELITYFQIPTVPDVITVDPARFEEYKRRLLSLQYAA